MAHGKRITAEVIDEFAKSEGNKKQRMPVCPCCGAKFSHDRAHFCCRVCGLPDAAEVDAGLIAEHRRRWQREQVGSKRKAKAAAHPPTRRRKKHGRR